ncbi:MAG: IS21-like element helper ATPase IstB [Bdellovibrionales bacterium]|nr:IS21-like element helper ATPase IstB [Bdellovibrionales bacterium]
MKEMRLLGMFNAFEALLRSAQNTALTPDELIAQLVEAEFNDRQQRKTLRCLRSARFRYPASIEETDFHTPRNLDKNQALRLADCSYLDRGENILITGPTGTGKSFLASALGHQACLKGKRVKYFNCRKLFEILKMAKADGSYPTFVRKLERMDLLILDDFGLEPIDGKARLGLLEIIEDRHGRRSTLIASQLPVPKWHEVIEEKTIADAVLDRLVHQAHRIELKGESLRKIRST